VGDIKKERESERVRARKKRDTKVQNKCCGTIDNSRAPLQNDQAKCREVYTRKRVEKED